MAKQEVGVVFIHGAGLGSWVWEDVITHITAPCLAIDFPGRGDDVSTTKTLALEDYTASTLAEIDDFTPKKIIIVAHSIGGLFGLEIARLRHERVAGFIAIGAAIPKDNQSFVSSMPFPNRLLLRIIMSLFGTKPSEKAITDGLCNNLNSAQTQKVLDRFVPESIRLFTDSIRRTVEMPRPLYVLLTHDKEFSVELQKTMSHNLRAQQIVELESGHLPMLSAPKEVANLVNEYSTSIFSSEFKNV